MSKPRYIWRSLSEEDRSRIMLERISLHRPLHSPPHWAPDGSARFHITAACYEHAPHIGFTAERMDTFAHDLLAACKPAVENLYAWCLLPNHYHLLVRTGDLPMLFAALGQLHGRTSFGWNGEENTRGRKVFHRAADRRIRTERHYFATLNYVLHNPVHHGYARRWEEWPWSNARDYLKGIGRGGGGARLAELSCFGLWGGVG